MTVTKKRPPKRPKFKKPSWHVSFKNPFGFPMDQALQMIIRNTRVRAGAKSLGDKWQPVVLRVRGQLLCQGRGQYTRTYLAQSSAILAAKLFIKYVREQKPRQDSAEVQLSLLFMSNSHAMAA